ncbi:DUF3857 domain-containing protein [Hymenobacter sp. B81]|uniref:DUF3857 domain-containing protein n=1 Tax=Hymenobacter sp. B81 TaxID=3344878 RepID=UPI0037DC73F0
MRSFFSALTASLLAALLLVAARPATAAYAGGGAQWPAFAIAAALRENAHAVVRQRDDVVRVEAAGRVVHGVRQVVTVLDAQGDEHGAVTVFYSKLDQINYLRGRLYDAAGQPVRALKSSDIRDYSAVSNGSLYEDNRVRVADLRQPRYPYTVEFEYEVTSENGLFLPGWQPQEEEHLSVEYATLRVTTPADLPLRYLEQRLPAGAVTANGQAEGSKRMYAWQLRDQPALECEWAGPRLRELAPAVLLGPSRFEVQGHAGDMSTWQTFGAWNYALNQGRAELPAEVKARVAALVKDAADEKERVRRVYGLLQSSTRYISVQLGLGGWQTFPASTVAATGYGDCKALSNYCMALLKEVGVESHCALIAAGAGRPALQDRFPAQQFNHVILCVPLRQGPKADTVWLECTSQSEAFNYLGDFTGGRHALLLTPQGGRLVRTPTYAAPDNRQLRRAEVLVDEQGNARATVRTISTARQQDELSQLLQAAPEDQRKRAYSRLGLAAVTIEQSSWQPDHRGQLPAVVERLTLALPRYASLTGRRLFLAPNLLNRLPAAPPRIGARRTPLVFDMGFVDADTVRYQLPAGYKPESVPAPVELTTPYGSYRAQVQVLPGGAVQYIRRLQMPQARFEPTQYEAYEDFRRRVSQADRVQLVFVKSES